MVGEVKRVTHIICMISLKHFGVNVIPAVVLFRACLKGRHFYTFLLHYHIGAARGTQYGQLMVGHFNFCPEMTHPQ